MRPRTSALVVIAVVAIAGCGGSNGDSTRDDDTRRSTTAETEDGLHLADDGSLAAQPSDLPDGWHQSSQGRWSGPLALDGIAQVAITDIELPEDGIEPQDVLDQIDHDDAKVIAQRDARAFGMPAREREFMSPDPSYHHVERVVVEGRTAYVISALVAQPAWAKERANIFRVMDSFEWTD